RGELKYGVFFAHPRESVTIDSERNPDDPRVALEFSELLDDETALDGSDQRFEDGWLDQTGLLPVLHGRFADRLRWSVLTGDGKDDQVWSLLDVGVRGDDDGGAPFRGRLVREGKRDQDDVAELKAGRSRHRRGCPRLS